LGNNGHPDKVHIYGFRESLRLDDRSRFRIPDELAAILHEEFGRTRGESNVPSSAFQRLGFYFAPGPASKIFLYPGSSDILAVWNYSLASRSPLHSAVSSDCGKSWRHLKLVEQSPYYGYHYTSIRFEGDRAYLLYSEYPLFESLCRSKTRTSHSDLKLTVLPIEWFYRSAQAE